MWGGRKKEQKVWGKQPPRAQHGKKEKPGFFTREVNKQKLKKEN